MRGEHTQLLTCMGHQYIPSTPPSNGLEPAWLMGCCELDNDNTLKDMMDLPGEPQGSTSLRAASAHTLFTRIVPFISVGRLRSPSINAGTR
jgi:hypothetical protein